MSVLLIWFRCLITCLKWLFIVIAYYLLTLLLLIVASLSFAFFLLDCSNVSALELYFDFETENDFIVMLLVHTCRTKYLSDGICGSQVSHCFGFKPLLMEKMAQRTNWQYIACNQLTVYCLCDIFLGSVLVSVMLLDLFFMCDLVNMIAMFLCSCEHSCSQQVTHRTRVIIFCCFFKFLLPLPFILYYLNYIEI